MSQIDELGSGYARELGTGEDAHRMLEEVAIRQSLANLRTFPFVAEREKMAPSNCWGAISPFAMANYGCSRSGRYLPPRLCDCR
jgi:hypothetical protein